MQALLEHAPRVPVSRQHRGPLLELHILLLEMLLLLLEQVVLQELLQV